MGKQGERRGRRYGEIKTGREPVSQGTGEMNQCAVHAHEIILQDLIQTQAIRRVEMNEKRIQSPLLIPFQQVV
jgi:hypothetical protein